ncbi:MAG TPA: hypothetical protein VHM19_00305 [Polyangiales bacterium]|nr:hypothetical protein [Polyangiales bacterium]
MLFAALLLAACGSPLVGAKCKSGLSLCDGQCVDTSANFDNCGTCGHSCGIFVCDNGTCTDKIRPDAGTPDGGPIDAGRDAAISGDSGMSPDGGPIGTGTTDGGFNPDPGLGGCKIGQQECAGICTNPLTDAENCGACGTHCKPNEVCSAGACDPVCDVDLVLCSGICVDLTTDPNNCAACDRVCESGICENNECADRVPGYVVVIGHDFTESNKAMSRIAGDAVFLGRGAPVRVLVYRGDATAQSVSGVEAAITGVSTTTGRAWKRTDAVDSIVPLQLQNADVFLIHAQSKARKSTLMKLGTEWGDALAQFVSTGGVIVLFEAPSTTNDGTYHLLEPSKIFSAASRDAVSTQQLKVVGWGLGVAMHVPALYQSLPNTSSFHDMTTPGTVMVQDSAANPVVVERVIVP